MGRHRLPLTARITGLGLLLFGSAATAQTPVLRPDSVIWPDIINGSVPQFGTDVATDGEWVAVTAPVDDQSASLQNVGAVHIFRRNAGSLEFVAKRFTGDEPSARSAYFLDVRDGLVAVSSVRALFSGNPEFRGQCSIFDLQDPSIPQVGYIRPDERLLEVGAGTLGAEVSVLDRDHVALAAPGFVGLRLASGGTPPPGGVVVFQRDGSDWTLKQVVSPGVDFEGLGGPLLGDSSNRAGRGMDFDGDRLAVGSRFGFSIYDWGADQLLHPVTVVDGDFLNYHTAFGLSIAIRGDLVAVGDWGIFNFSAFPARVHLYRESGGAWSREDTLYPSDGWQASLGGSASLANSAFGQNIVIDEEERLLIGAPSGQRGGTTTVPSAELPGTAYVFKKTASGWEEQLRLWEAYDDHQSEHGDTVALLGDMAIVGARLAEPVGSTEQVGAVNTFLLPFGETVCDGELNSSGARGALEIVGDRDVSFGHLEVRASSLPAGASSMLLASRDTAFVANPGASSGNLCLGGSIARFVGSIDDADPAGEVSFAVPGLVVPTPGGPESIETGDTWSFQVWYRDNDPAPTSNFTETRSVSFE